MAFNASTTDDPIMLELIEKKRKELQEQEEELDEKAVTVFGTDLLLAALMSAPRSVYAWDLVFNKKDGVIVIDKRDNTLDWVNVDETSRDPPLFEHHAKNINSAQNLRQEATRINLAFQQQIVDRVCIIYVSDDYKMC